MGSRPIALAVLRSKPPNEVGLLPQKVGSRPIALAVLGSKPPNEVGLLAQKGDLLDSFRNLNSYMGIAHPSEHFAPQIYRSAQTLKSPGGGLCVHTGLKIESKSGYRVHRLPPEPAVKPVLSLPKGLVERTVA